MTFRSALEFEHYKSAFVLAVRKIHQMDIDPNLVFAYYWGCD